MAAEYLQAKIGYEFMDVGLLDSALTAAHRSDEHSPSFDGNRGLASLGTCVIEMVHALYTVVVERGTQRDVNKCESWYRTKRGQARACVKLGIDRFVKRSIRQQHDGPSPTVLSNALTATIGAIWLDLGGVNEGTSNACEQIFLILREIRNVVTDLAPTFDESNSTPLEMHHGSIAGEISDSTTPNRNADPLNASMTICSSESQHEPLPCPYPWLLPHDAEPDFDAYGPIEAERMSSPPKNWNFIDILEAHTQNTHVLHFGQCTSGNASDSIGLPTPDAEVAQSEQIAPVDNGGMAGFHHRPLDTSKFPQAAVKTGNGKNPREQRRGRRHNSSLHQRLVDEELEKLHGFPGSGRRGDLAALLDHPRISELSTNASYVGQLRLLYLGIASCSSLIQFREILRVARTRPNAFVHSTTGPNLLPVERFREICVHDDQEALSVLVRRYHVVKLFETELENLRQDSGMIVETPSGFGTSHTPQAGNPAMMQEAALTDRLLAKVAPDLVAETVEFRKVRDRLTQMRRLAKKLQVLTGRYGFGVLALLPCGPSYMDFTITDCTLKSIPDTVFAQFSELLYEQQGTILTEFSKAVEPALTSLVHGKLESEPFPIESTDASNFEGLPKGSQELLSLCVRGASPSL